MSQATIPDKGPRDLENLGKAGVEGRSKPARTQQPSSSVRKGCCGPRRAVRVGAAVLSCAAYSLTPFAASAVGTQSQAPSLQDPPGAKQCKAALGQGSRRVLCSLWPCPRAGDSHRWEQGWHWGSLWPTWVNSANT